VAKSSDPLDKWRQFEREYAEASAPFLSDDDAAPRLGKDELVELVALRGKADRWREKYFKHGREAQD
jgi:hypothetical protein